MKRPKPIKVRMYRRKPRSVCIECGAILRLGNISGYCRRHLILARWRRQTAADRCSAPDCIQVANNPYSPRPFCKMHEARLYRTGSLETTRRSAVRGAPCEYCDQPVVSTRLRRFCSARCRARHERGVPAVKECVECGTAFAAPFKSNTNACSAACRESRARRFMNVSSREGSKKRRKVGRVSALPKGTIKKLGAIQKWRCAICRSRIKKHHHLDHIMPLSRGGPHLPRNLQLLCAPCNMRKGARDPIVHMRSLGLLL